MKHTTALLALFLSGCGSFRGSVTLSATEAAAQPITQTAATLASMGDWLVWAGGALLALSLIIRVASLFIPVLRPIATLAVEAAIIGACCLLAGAFFSWLALHLWLLWCVGGVLLVAWLWYRRFVIERLFSKIIAGEKS